MPQIGVLLVVPEPWGEELRRHRVDFGDDAGRYVPTHVTLLPPHEVGEAGLAALLDHLQGVADRTAPFAVHLRGTGTFRPVSPVVFVNLVEGISGCEQLAADVLSGPVRLEREFPYHPHVTVAHHLDDAGLDHAFDVLADYEATYTAGEMWLYHHDPELGWRPDRAFGFTG